MVRKKPARRRRADRAVKPVRTPAPSDVSGTPDGSVVAWWRAAAIAAGALVLALGSLLIVWLLARPLALLIAAIAIAEAVAPLVDRLERRMPRPLAVAAVFLALAAVLAGLGWTVVPRLAAQAGALTEEAPELIARAQELINDWDPAGEQRIVAAIEQSVGRFSESLVMLPLRIVSSVVQIVLVLFMSAYWLISRPAIGAFAKSLAAPDNREHVGDVGAELGSTIGGYIRGEVISGLIIGTLTYAGLTVIGVDYALVLALIAGFAELVPVIGPIVAAVPAVVVAFLDSPTKALVALGFYVVLQQVESNLIIPNVMRHQAHVPPLLTLIAVFAGGELGGILGALVAIPVAGAAKVLVVRLVAPAVRRWTGAMPAGVPDRGPSPTT